MPPPNDQATSNTDALENLRDALLLMAERLEFADRDMFLECVERLDARAKAIRNTLTGDRHPLAKFAGALKDDPFIEDMVRSSRRRR